jgi:hypothetical protein
VDRKQRELLKTFIRNIITSDDTEEDEINNVEDTVGPVPPKGEKIRYVLDPYVRFWYK